MRRHPHTGSKRTSEESHASLDWMPGAPAANSGLPSGVPVKMGPVPRRRWSRCAANGVADSLGEAP